MAREGFFAFNVAREEFLSVNLASQLEKLPTPALDKLIMLTIFHNREIPSHPHSNERQRGWVNYSLVRSVKNTPKACNTGYI